MRTLRNIDMVSYSFRELERMKKIDELIAEDKRKGKESKANAKKIEATPEEIEEQILNKNAKYSKQNKANRSKGHRF